MLRKLLGTSSPLVLARVISTALTFGLPLMLVRLLRPAELGTYKQFFLVVMSLHLIGQMGLTQSLTYFLPRGDAGRGSYVAHALLLLWALALILGLGLFVAAPRVGNWLGSGELAALRLPLALTAALLLATAPIESALIAEGRIRASALASALSDGVRALLLVAAARLGASAIFWAPVAVGVLRLGALVALVGGRVLPVARPDRARLVQQLRFALPFAGASLFFVAQRYSSQYLVSVRFDVALFPLFTIAYFHFPVVDIVFTPITEVLMVGLGKSLGRDPRATQAHWNEAIVRLASILLPAVAGAWLLGPTMLPILFTDQYRAAVPLFMLATLQIPLSILPVDALLRAAGDTRFLFIFNAVRIPAAVALVLLGIHHGGLAGAIVGNLVAEALARVGLLLRGRRFLAGPLVDWAALGRVALAAALACVPACAVRVSGAHGLRLVLPSMAVYGIAYFMLRAALLPIPLGGGSFAQLGANLGGDRGLERSDVQEPA
jgi:O-antigen/teichoic acid export membrane protein